MNIEQEIYAMFGKRLVKKKKEKEGYNNALEELEDMGFEILNNYKDKDGNYGIRKISIDIQFYEDGSWCLDSGDSKGINATLESGDSLIKILPTLKHCRDVFLKTIKEIDEKEAKKC